MSAPTGDIVERFWQFTLARDWESLAGILDEQMLYEIPQTRERVRGREAFIEFFATYPGDWTLEVDSIVADEAEAVSKISFDVDGNQETGISFFEFRDGLISRIVDYWPTPYDPPARMTAKVERY